MKKLSDAKLRILQNAVDQIYAKKERLMSLIGDFGIGNEFIFRQNRRINKEIGCLEDLIARFSFQEEK